MTKGLFSCALGIGVLGACAVAVAAAAAPTHADLRQLETQLQQERAAQQENRRKAEALSQEVADVQKRMIALAKTVQSKEEALSTLEERRDDLSEREKALQKSLALTDAQIVRLVSGLQTAALRPRELLWLSPNGPVDLLRGQALMRDTLPMVSRTNDKLRADLAELTRVRSSLQSQILEIKTTTAQLSERTEQMDRLLQQKALLQAQYDASHQQAKQRAQTLAAQASDLKDLLKKLEEEQRRRAELKRQERMQATRRLVEHSGRLRPGQSTHLMPRDTSYLTGSGAPQNAFEKSRGLLKYPARGQVIQVFGEATASGAHTKGITLKARPSAHVVAPFDGTVLFAGPFKNYGQLMIIDNGDDYMTLLAGMDRMNVGVGQEVLTGEPVGVLKESNPTLYIEIRKGGQPVDPQPWFAA